MLDLESTSLEQGSLCLSTCNAQLFKTFYTALGVLFIVTQTRRLLVIDYKFILNQVDACFLLYLFFTGGCFKMESVYIGLDVLLVLNS